MARACLGVQRWVLPHCQLGASLLIRELFSLDHHLSPLPYNFRWASDMRTTRREKNGARSIEVDRGRVGAERKESGLGFPVDHLSRHNRMKSRIALGYARSCSPLLSLKCSRLCLVIPHHSLCPTCSTLGDQVPVPRKWALTRLSSPFWTFSSSSLSLVSSPTSGTLFAMVPSQRSTTHFNRTCMASEQAYNGSGHSIAI